MITEECKRIAYINRARHDAGARKDSAFLPFPEGCECACMHRFPEDWHKQFRSDVIPPWKKTLRETDIL